MENRPHPDCWELHFCHKATSSQNAGTVGNVLLHCSLTAPPQDAHLSIVGAFMVSLLAKTRLVATRHPGDASRDDAALPAPLSFSPAWCSDNILSHKSSPRGTTPYRQPKVKLHGVAYLACWLLKS